MKYQENGIFWGETKGRRGFHLESGRYKNKVLLDKKDKLNYISPK
jgi:hypothetical protein